MRRVVLQRALLALLIPGVLEAQVIRGSLVREDGTTAAEGVIVVARSVGADSILARTLSNSTGRFSLTVRPGRVKLSALRIGQLPFEIGEIALTPTDTQSVRVVLPHAPIMLPTVTTTAQASCRLSGAEGAAVAAAYDEARKAILSTTLSAEEGPPIARFSTFTQERTVGNRALTPKMREFAEGPSRSPFASLSPEDLAENGYQLSRQSETSYWAPDANVFLSDIFVAGHCLGLVRNDSEHDEWAGLTFRPVKLRRGVVDVSGILWIDRATSELRRVEFRYEGLPTYLARLQLGGRLEFTRLAEGSWFISEWEIRMPRMTWTDRGGRVSGLHVAGGDVWRMRRGDEVLFSNGIDEPKRTQQLGPKVLVELPTERAAAVQADTLMTTSVCDAKATGWEGLLEGVVRDGSGRPVVDATVRVEWQEGHLRLEDQLNWRTRVVMSSSAGDGSFTMCGVPSERLISVQARFGPDSTERMVVRLAPGQRRSRVDLRIARVDRAVAGVAIRVRDVAERPIAYAVVQVEGGRERVADESGRVTMASAPDSLRVSVRRIGYAPFDGRVGRGASGEFEVRLPPIAQRLGTVTVMGSRVSPMLELRGFYDRMLRTQRGAFNGEFITPEELETRPNLRATDVLYGRRSIRVARDDRGRAFALGRADCTPSVFLDGVHLMRDSVSVGNKKKLVTLIDELVPLSALAGVELYASASTAPPELQPAVGAAEEASCGILVFWTGSRR